MEYRKFKPGDRVRKKSGGPVMEVVKYAMEHEALVGDVQSIHDVLCVWFDENEERHKDVFDQRTLFKVEENQGLFSVKD
jgi:uncharacterized protein YodC (DUF2158 family)